MIERSLIFHQPLSKNLAKLVGLRIIQFMRVVGTWLQNTYFKIKDGNLFQILILECL